MFPEILPEIAGVRNSKGERRRIGIGADEFLGLADEDLPRGDLARGEGLAGESYAEIAEPSKEPRAIASSPTMVEAEASIPATSRTATAMAMLANDFIVIGFNLDDTPSRVQRCRA
jgi:hypothetical protein